MTRCVMLPPIMFPEPTPNVIPALALVRQSSPDDVEEADRIEEMAMARYRTSRDLLDIAEAAERRAEAMARLEYSLRRGHSEAA
jgi:hypothetical protein